MAYKLTTKEKRKVAKQFRSLDKRISMGASKSEKRYNFSVMTGGLRRLK